MIKIGLAKRKKKLPLLGFTVYEGASEIDGSPIVAIITIKTKNRKIGNMSQLWILPKSISPLNALQRGKNSGICGACPLQGTPYKVNNRIRLKNRVCYVNVGQSPQAIYKAYQRGRYPKYNEAKHRKYIDDKPIRLGAYGDPAALPIELLEYLIGIAKEHTGYSHQLFAMERTRANKLASILMVSCHNLAQANEAKRREWRSFTVIAPGQNPPANTIECPAYTRGIHCAQCKLCQGSDFSAKSIYVLAHAKNGLNLPKIQ